MFILGRNEGRSTELLNVEEKSEDEELTERILERLKCAYVECKGHDSNALPRIEVRTIIIEKK